jgi:hypothetical protein
MMVVENTPEVHNMVVCTLCQPAGTGAMTEEALAALVTRDAMEGVAKVAAPAEGPNA